MQGVPKVSSITRPRERTERAGTASSVAGCNVNCDDRSLGLLAESSRRARSVHSYRSHHAAIFVIEDMAMEHKRSAHDWITKIDE
jgi:hypothetical protein